MQHTMESDKPNRDTGRCLYLLLSSRISGVGHGTRLPAEESASRNWSMRSDQQP